jgi:putative (di)nucleoside polyphosphate hydrolase
MPRPARCASWRKRPGIRADKVEIIARCPEELFYDLPADLVGKLWKGRWRGQRQSWFLCRFTGRDEDIDLNTAHPEFRAWKWADPDELPATIVPFKKKLYEDVLTAFRPWLKVEARVMKRAGSSSVPARSFYNLLVWSS